MTVIVGEDCDTIYVATLNEISPVWYKFCPVVPSHLPTRVMVSRGNRNDFGRIYLGKLLGAGRRCPAGPDDTNLKLGHIYSSTTHHS
jgi:hypothetical protein